MLQQARELAELLGGTLDEFVDDVLPDGVVIISPDVVVTARILGDAAIITLAIGRGSLHRLFALAPAHVTKVGWARELHNRPEVTFYEINKLKQRFKDGQQTKNA